MERGDKRAEKRKVKRRGTVEQDIEHGNKLAI